MIKISEAPKYQNPGNTDKLFLAGGITGCRDWQRDVINMLIKKDDVYPFNLTIFNPRRVFFPIDIPDESEIQIIWEYKHLDLSNLIVFWFTDGSVNPIALYELGLWGNSKNAKNKKIFVGCDPKYTRISDVTIQTKLAHPSAIIYDSLETIVHDIAVYLSNGVNDDRS